MKKIVKYVLIAAIVTILSGLHYNGFKITPVSYQYPLNAHRDIGKEIIFSQPIGYSVRNSPKAIVPIVNKIENELGSPHIMDIYYEKTNQYILSKTIFKIIAIYAYADIMNKKELYYVLADKTGKKYIIGEYFFRDLMKPIYLNSKVPSEVLDELYSKKHFIKMKFYTIKENNSRLTSSYFNKCNIKDFSENKWQAEVVATIDFKNLVCLYSYFWDDFNSEAYPISFEVLDN